MESLHYLLMKSNSILAKNIMFNANKIGLTSGQPKILYCLSKFKEADQKTIANYCEIEQATVGSILLGMENAGLIVRKQHEGNRRSLYVSLTDKGIEAADNMQIIFDNVENKVMQKLSNDEIILLKNLLLKVYDSLSNNKNGAENE